MLVVGGERVVDIVDALGGKTCEQGSYFCSVHTYMAGD